MTGDSTDSLAPSATDSRWRWLCLIAIAASVAAYAASWTGGLVWDDHYFVDGSAIGGGESIWNCFTVPFLNHYFRPLVSLNFYFERRLWHDNALGYRLVNTALHALCTGIMMGLARDAFRSRRAGFFAGLVFALHPVQVGAVAWIGGRTDTLCQLWLLLFARCLIIAAQSVTRRGPLLGWAVIWYTLALFTKEQALALLPLVPLAFRCWKPTDGENRPRSEWVFTLPFAAICALFIGLGWSLGMPRPQALVGSFADQILQAGNILAYYALVLLTPTPALMHLLSLGPFERAGTAPAIFGYLAALGALALLAWLWRRDRASAWCLALTLLSLLPVSGFLPLPFLLVAPYRAAIGCIGFAALAGRALSSVCSVFAVRPIPTVVRAVGCALAASALCAYSVLTVWGAIQWRDEVSLFQRLARTDPDAIVPPYVVSYMLAARNQPGLAARQMEAALANLFRSDAWKDAGKAVRALREDPSILRRARQNQGGTADPHIWIATVYNDLAQLYLRVGETGAALAAYQAGEAIDPKNPDVVAGIGYIYSTFGNDAEAIRRMRRAIAIAPKHLYSLEWLARYYALHGQWESAVSALTAWSDAAPWNDEAKRMLQDAKTQAERRRALESGTLFRGR